MLLTKAQARGLPLQRQVKGAVLCATDRGGTCVFTSRKNATKSWVSSVAKHAIGQRKSVQHITRCLPSAPVISSTSSITPDLTLSHPDYQAKVYVFGVDHLQLQPHMGRFILEHKPSALVCETALGNEHGAAPGNILNCQDPVMGPAAFYQRMFCGMSAALKELVTPEAIIACDLWQGAEVNLNGEQLAYVAALTVGAKLVFGDRPKDITYKRLYGLPSIAELDSAYDQQVASDYIMRLGLPPASVDHANLPLPERICMQEREAVMCSVVHDILRGKIGTGSDPTKPVVMVIGGAHLPGIEHLWEDDRWKSIVGGPSLASSAVMRAPEIDSRVPDAGLRRAVMEGFMRLSVTQEVLNDVEIVLGSVDPAQQAQYEAVVETYGSTRMQLAALHRPLFDKVVGGFQCDMWEVLQPLRDIRPCNGGPGADPDLLEELRGLHFEVQGGAQ